MLAVKRLPYLFVGWLWYAITLLPVIGIIQSGDYAMADRYHYLPSIGIAVMLAWGIPLLFTRENMRKKILFPAGIVFLVHPGSFNVAAMRSLEKQYQALERFAGNKR